jgi:predicted ATP-dependent serine protease
MPVICAGCTRLISSKTPKCPQCGHHGALPESQILSQPTFGRSIEKQLQSQRIERLFLATVLGVFSAAMLTTLIFVFHHFTSAFVIGP